MVSIYSLKLELTKEKIPLGIFILPTKEEPAEETTSVKELETTEEEPTDIFGITGAVVGVKPNPMIGVSIMLITIIGGIIFLFLFNRFVRSK